MQRDNLWTIGNEPSTNRAHSNHQGLWSGHVFWQGFCQVGALSWQTHSRCPRKYSAFSRWRRGQMQETSAETPGMLESTDIFNNIICIHTKYFLLFIHRKYCEWGRTHLHYTMSTRGQYIPQSAAVNFRLSNSEVTVWTLDLEHHPGLNAHVFKTRQTLAKRWKTINKCQSNIHVKQFLCLM